MKYEEGMVDADLQMLKWNLDNMLDALELTGGDPIDIASLKVAIELSARHRGEYLFEPNETPNVCPRCANCYSEIQEYTEDDDVKHTTYRYVCGEVSGIGCGLEWYWYEKYGEFMSWGLVE